MKTGQKRSYTTIVPGEAETLIGYWPLFINLSPISKCVCTFKTITILRLFSVSAEITALKLLKLGKGWVPFFTERFKQLTKVRYKVEISIAKVGTNPRYWWWSYTTLKRL